MPPGNIASNIAYTIGSSGMKGVVTCQLVVVIERLVNCSLQDKFVQAGSCAMDHSQYSWGLILV